MSVSVQQRGKRFQLRVKDRLLPRPFFFTFDTEPEARSYGEQLQALLRRGIVPSELLADQPKGDDPLVVEIIRGYINEAATITESDDALLGLVIKEVVGLRTSGLTYAWAEVYVRKLKGKRLAPSSIRKRVGALGRVVDWHTRRTSNPGQVPPANVLRLLPAGYSVYSRKDATGMAPDEVPADIERNRRLTPEEESRCMDALAGEKREDRERALASDPELTMLFRLILDTGMRLREAYRLRVDQVDIERGVISVEGSKGHRGAIKPRWVPIKPALAPLLASYMRGRIGRLFSFWDGTPEGLRKATNRLSNRFKTLFDYAEVPDCTEHDLRHEATCRWVLMKHKAGGWAFNEIEICRIMGWKDTKMMLRYASLRGKDLADRMAGVA